DRTKWRNPCQTGTHGNAKARRIQDVRAFRRRLAGAAEIAENPAFNTEFVRQSQRKRHFDAAAITPFAAQGIQCIFVARADTGSFESANTLAADEESVKQSDVPVEQAGNVAGVALERQHPVLG